MDIDVIEWAKDFLALSESELSPEELKEQIKYADLIQNPNDKAMLTRLLDESSQIRSSKRLAIRIRELIDHYGVPSFFSPFDRLLLKLYRATYKVIYPVAIPIFKYRLHTDTSKVIINEKKSILNKHLSSRNSDKIGQNVNLLGEVVLGDGEADKRYFHYLEALEDPRINYISVKISGIYAQISALNYQQNKHDLCNRLSTIYAKAQSFTYVDVDGSRKHKFVNLDMEEYKDCHLTLDVFTEVLSRPDFKNFSAGIVIQAYLPDSWGFQTLLLDFAKKRVEDGGAPIKIRLVKGANLQMESIISSLKGWEVPVYDTKVEVDANYLKILDRALLPENAKVAKIGVASHNFFTIGYALLLSKKNGVEDALTFEMLEGMANHLPRTLRKLDKQIILYTPVVSNANFLNAVSYLVRRLDENTGKDNFLSYSFNLKLESKAWNFLKNQFIEAYQLRNKISNQPRRVQDRNLMLAYKMPETTFKNEADTDFDLPQNRRWAEYYRNKWFKDENSQRIDSIPVQIADKQYKTGKVKKYFDRSQDDKVQICELYLSNENQVTEMIEIAVKDESAWRLSKMSFRKDVLHRTAVNLANKRGDLIACMTSITSKTFTEGDVEVSEAIDFCRFYPITMESFRKLDTVDITPKGVVFVIPPWNFPLAIPVGGVAAALSAGNTVILKPATVAYPVAWEFAQCFWDAGVPKDALQLVCADSREALSTLTTHKAIKHIILTGGTDTALNLLKVNPTCPLSAETGGKNAMILTKACDRDHAIMNIISSAFSNAGQKCSACSLLILDKELYNDEVFKSKIIDAVTSLQVGSAWNPANYVGPMITSQNDKLLYAIDHLEEGEYWLVPPVFVDSSRYVLKPTVKWGVKPGSYTFRTELFGPLLGVVCMDDLAHGIELANSSEYGLTAGLQSLDEKEQELWKNSIEAGNLYINRGITGAIVSRQPFGGMKKSAYGGGIKAGSPNYVSCFVEYKEMNSDRNISSKVLPQFSYLADLLNSKDKHRFFVACDNYRRNYQEEFSQEKDIHQILGESNVFRYLSLDRMVLRMKRGDNFIDAALILAAAEICKTPIDISIDPQNKLLPLVETLKNKYEVYEEKEIQFYERMNQYDRVRLCCNSDASDILNAASETGLYIAYVAPVIEGRLELLHYLKEQSVSTEYHRYGNIVGGNQ